MVLARFAVAAVSVLLFLGQASADLYPRQSLNQSGIPVPCQSGCATTINAINACSTAACICTTTNANDLVSCVDCSVENDFSLAHEAHGQEILDAFTRGCNARGFSIGPLRVSVSVTAATAAATDTASDTNIFSQLGTITSAPTSSPTSNPFKSGAMGVASGSRNELVGFAVAMVGLLFGLACLG